MTETLSSRRGRQLLLWLGIPLLLVCVYPIAFYVSRVWRTPDDKQHQALATAVRNTFKPGDVLIGHPWYLQKPYTQLGDLPFAVLRTLHPDDLLAYRRVHLVRLAGAPGEGVAQALANNYREVQQGQFGPLHHHIYHLTDKPPLLFNFARNVQKAQVSIHKAQQAPIPCKKWNHYKWECPQNADWNFVGREYLDYDDVPRPLIWAHPVADGGTLHIRYENVPKGEVLVGSHAFTRWAAVRAKHPVTLTIEINGRRLAQEHLPVVHGLKRFRYRLGHLTTPQVNVTFIISTPRNDAAHYGFTAMMATR